MTDPARPSDDDLGRAVRSEWDAWAREQPDVADHPSWTRPWDDMAERDKDADRRIGRALFNVGVVTAMRTLRDVNESMSGMHGRSGMPGVASAAGREEGS